jgi:hypothetical protein
MQKKNVRRAGIAIGFVLCLVFASLLIFPVASAEDEETLIRGMVKDYDGYPISAGTVTLLNVHTGETMTTEISKGQVYEFNVDPGFYQVSAVGDFYLDTGDGISETFMADKGEVKVVNPDLKLKKIPHDVTIEGFILDNGGDGVGNATVTAYATEAAFAGYELSTTTLFEGNDSGKFSLDLYNGNFDLYATMDGYEYTIMPIIVNATSTQFNLTLVKSGDPPCTISGYAMDEDLDYLTGVRAWAYDINNKRYIESSVSGGSYFEIKIYKGIFDLIVDVPGYLTYVHKSINIDPAVPGNESALINAVLEKDLDEDIQTTITVSDGFVEITVVSKWIITSASELYGLDPMDMGCPRMQIDRALGDGDGTVTPTEANLFKTWLQDAGPFYLYTDEFFLINNTAFGPGDALDYTVLEVSGVPGPVGSKGEMFARTRMVYHIEVDEEEEEEEESPSAYLIDVLALRNNEVITLIINDTWEILDTTEDEWYREVIDEVPRSMQVHRTAGPEALIEVINDGDFFVERDENETIVQYICDAEQNITLRSQSTDDVGAIMNTTWFPGEGIAAKYDDEITFQYQNQGPHTVRLKVTDSSGLTAETTVSFYVDIRAPIISVTITNATDVDITDPPWREDEETSIVFNASGTYDDVFEKEELEFIWIFGDDSAPVPGNVTSHSFAKPGTYNITLEVKDPLGHNATQSFDNFEILDTTPPWMVINIPQTVTIKEEFTANASQSYDEDWPEEDRYDLIKEYDWYFDWDEDDEENMTVDTSGKVVNWTFYEPGTYTIKLKGTDMSGNVGETTRTIDVLGPNLLIGMEPKIKPKKDIEEKDKIKFTVNVTNNGDIRAENVTIAVFYKDGDDYKRIDDKLIPKLDKDEAINITLVWKEAQRPNDKDTVEILFRVDPDDTIKELNEDDNNWTVKLKIKADWTTWIVIGIICLIIVVLIVAYVVYRKFFGPEEEDEDRAERRRKAGRKKKDDDDDDWDDDDDDEGIGGKIGGLFGGKDKDKDKKKGRGRKKKDDDDDDDD